MTALPVPQVGVWRAADVAVVPDIEGFRIR